MKLASRTLAFAAVLLLCVAGSSSAQYMKLTSDNPDDPTRMRPTGTTILTITLDTNHDRDGSLQTCNSHNAVNCGTPLSNAPLNMFAYTLAFRAVGGTVAWGTFTASDPAYTELDPQISNSTETEINQFRPTETFTPPGLVTIGTLPVTVMSGNPSVEVQMGAGTLNPFGFGTGFGTECKGPYFLNTYVLGDPADPCGVASGSPGDWFDADGVGASAPASAITLSFLHEMSLNPGSTADQAFSASDPDGNAIAFSSTGPAFMTVLSNTQVGNTRTGTIHLAPPIGLTGTFSASLTASTTGAANTRAFTIRVVGVPPFMNQPESMTVAAGSTADQEVAATDQNGDPLTFSLTSGPTYATVTTIDPGHGTAVGNIHLAPGLSDVGTTVLGLSVTDGTFAVSSIIVVTVTGTPLPPPPVIDPICTLSVEEGGTLDFDVTARDPGGAMVLFSFTGPAFMTLTPSPDCGAEQHANLHLAPPIGTAGSYSATVSAEVGLRMATQSFTIEVTAAEQPPPPGAQSPTYEAKVYLSGDDRVIRLSSRSSSWCAELEPGHAAFQAADVVSTSVIATFGDARIQAIETKTVKGGPKNGVPRLAGFFSRDDLRKLFAALPDGKRTVDILLSGSLSSGGTFKAPASVPVEKGDLSLGRAGPNPFNPSTTISFELSQPGKVRLRIFDVSGRLVSILADGIMGAGLQEVRWDGKTGDGAKVSSGVYFYVLETPEGAIKRSLVLAK